MQTRQMGEQSKRCLLNKWRPTKDMFGWLGECAEGGGEGGGVNAGVETLILIVAMAKVLFVSGTKLYDPFNSRYTCY